MQSIGAMAPQKFASVRYKTNPVARITPFRDDTNLVGVRYEQTKQAELPIPLPAPKSLPKAPRPPSTIRPSVSLTPLVVVPPPFPPPPQEEHPLFRRRGTTRSADGPWKRDSGLAATASSSTIHEEFNECIEFPRIANEGGPSRGSVDEPIVKDATPSPRPSLSPSLSPSQSPSLSSSLGRSLSPSPSLSPSLSPSPSPSRCRSPRLGRLNLFGLTSRSPTPDTLAESSMGSPVESPAESPTTEGRPTSPSRTPSFTEKLSKTFSMRSGPTKRLRKKSLSEDKESMSEVTSARGSLKSAKSTNPRQKRNSEDRVSNSSSPSHETVFVPITTHIPAVSLFDEFDTLSFSKRGSVMFGGKRALDRYATSPLNMMAHEDTETPDKAIRSPNQADTGSAARAPTTPASAAAPLPTSSPTQHGRISEEQPAQSSPKPSAAPSIRLLSADVERESQKVRSLYEPGDGLDWREGAPGFSLGDRLEPTEEVPLEEDENVVSSPPSDAPSSDPSGANPPPETLTPSPALATAKSLSSLSARQDSDLLRVQNGPGGGIEDWQDVEGADVDRYGFITERRPASSSGSPEATRPSHLSPRRRHLLGIGTRPSSAYSSSPHGPFRAPGRKISARSLNTYTSEFSTVSRRSVLSSIRSVTNHLPHNKDRRWMDEAGEMLSLQPGIVDIAEDSESVKIAAALKRKEWERSEKWRKMAKVVRNGAEGAATQFEFDVKNQKLIERTWKGIPDCWRSAAWYSFLATSARAWNDQATDQTLTDEFHRLQGLSSPDDVQIDLDVPRTINRHIMFRKRYSGGQRLLFRVLHAISLYYPDTGYVQGMAALAATLLCYYEEERCFIMLVRLWRYRGLEKLYEPGFGGLMDALGDFEKKWLGDKEVASKLKELCIDPTAYGTRWYLTLFNLSLPFPAQLRVWDVFMLLGESPLESASSPPPPPSSAVGAKAEAAALSPEAKTKIIPTQDLDVLHATSAALIEALREVLLDSDFENAMKALTSWIPVKSEELLMKVTRAEWKRHHRVGKKNKA